MEAEEEVRSQPGFCCAPRPQLLFLSLLFCVATPDICSRSPSLLPFPTFVSLWAFPFHTRGGTVRSHGLLRPGPCPGVTPSLD